MTNINRIAVPSFEATLQQLLLLAQTYPHREADSHFMDLVHDRPHDLVGHALAAMGADYEAFRGRRDSHIIAERGMGTGTPWNRVRLELIFDRVFDTNVMFLAGCTDDKTAEDYAVYALLGHMQAANDRSDVLDWAHAFRRGLMSFRRFFFSQSSGFALQVTRHPQGVHQGPRPSMVRFIEAVDTQTSQARQAITATIEEQYNS